MHRRSIHYRLSLRQVIIALVIVTTLGLGWRFLPMAWAITSDSVHKWAWSGQIDTTPNNYGQLYGLGWLSTNCLNDFDNDGVLDSQCRNSSYGLNVDVRKADNTSTKNRLDDDAASSTFNGVNDYLKGCAWSDIFGWVCFDQSSSCPSNHSLYGNVCSQLSSDGVKIEKFSNIDVYYLKSSVNPSSAGDDKYDGILNNPAQKDARATVLNLAQTGEESRAFVGFPFDSTTQVSPTGDVTGCFGCWAASGGYSNSCKGCYLTNDGFTDSTLAPNPNILCVNCTQCQNSVYGGSCTGTQNRCHASSCSACYKVPGVVVNYYPSCSNNGTYCAVDGNCTGGAKCDYTKSSAEMCGWGYNAWADAAGKQQGFGWIAFNPVVYGSAAPYTQAQRGSVYSENNILSYLAPPQGQSNAAYLIDAKGTITRWISSSTPESVRPFLTTAPTFLSYDFSTGHSTSTVGSIDWQGISGRYGTDQYNKFGSEVLDVDDSYFAALNSLKLNNKVYFSSRALTINKAIEIQNGNNDISGAGIIFVGDNLTINKNITYQTGGTLSRVQHIPSLVWIVLGDVTIDPSVTDIVGTFIVLGQNGNNKCPAVIDPINPPDSEGCGRFTTGNDRTAPKQLKISGNVIAKQLNLQRSYFSTDTKGRNQPAEVFIADGRLQANPPAGLKDLSKSLPRFSFGF